MMDALEQLAEKTVAAIIADDGQYNLDSVLMGENCYCRHKDVQAWLAPLVLAGLKEAHEIGRSLVRRGGE